MNKVKEKDGLYLKRRRLVHRIEDTKDEINVLWKCIETMMFGVREHEAYMVLKATEYYVRKMFEDLDAFMERYNDEEE